MKATLLILTALLCFAPVGHAEVFIYKNKLKSTATGGGGVTKENIAGWTVISDSGDVTQVLAYPKPKRFAIVPMKSIEFGSATGAQGRQYMFFLQHDIWTGGDGSYHVDTGGAKGANSVMSVNGGNWLLPKTMSWGGRSTYVAPGGGSMTFLESSGNFSFDKQWTNTSNAQGDNLEAAVARLAADLQQKGYTEY